MSINLKVNEYEKSRKTKQIKVDCKCRRLLSNLYYAIKDENVKNIECKRKKAENYITLNNQEICFLDAGQFEYYLSRLNYLLLMLQEQEE